MAVDEGKGMVMHFKWWSGKETSLEHPLHIHEIALIAGQTLNFSEIEL